MSSDLSLDALPNEILFRIFSFLDSAFILHVLNRVCKSFELLLSENAFWRTKLFQKWPKPYPVVPVSDDFDWKEACLEREEHYKRWTSWASSMKSLRIGDPHIGHVTTIQILRDGTHCASGSKGRDIKIWNIQDCDSRRTEEGSRRLLHSLPDAHQGWVWCFCTDDNLLLSGAWDKTVKTWDLAQGCKRVSSLSFESAVLCVCQADKLLCASTYVGIAHLHDSRESAPVDQRLVLGKGPVTCMAMDETLLIAGCRDGSMTVVDLRTRKVRQKFRKFDGYPSAVSFHSNQVWVGTKNGSVITMDASTDRLRRVQNVSVEKGGHCLISGIHHSLGSVLFCIMGSAMYALEPTLQAKVIACGDKKEEVSRFQVHEDTLVTASSDNIQVWRPS